MIGLNERLGCVLTINGVSDLVNSRRFDFAQRPEINIPVAERSRSVLSRQTKVVVHEQP